MGENRAAWLTVPARAGETCAHHEAGVCRGPGACKHPGPHCAGCPGCSAPAAEAVEVIAPWGAYRVPLCDAHRLDGA